MTYVPDDNFEQKLIDLGIDTDSTLNDSVATANIRLLTSLQVINASIADLTGIEDFTALTNLNVGGNSITSLNVSFCTLLSVLGCQNNTITSLDVSQNTALTILNCKGNSLTSLNVSQNTVLTSLKCFDNQLTSLDVRNGNNTNFNIFNSTNNTNLYCINVDSAAWSTANWSNVDSWASFSNNCQNEIVGCMDSTALNYNSSATIDNGFCIVAVFGCIDSLAYNYDSNANTDDGSCEYCDLSNLFMVFQNTTNNCDGVILANSTSSNLPISFLWSTGSTLNNITNLCSGTYILSVTDAVDCTIDTSITIGQAPISGCTNPTAINYDPLATIDDGTCTYSICDAKPTGLNAYDITDTRFR